MVRSIHFDTPIGVSNYFCQKKNYLMSYIYFFLIIFIPLYALLVEKDDFFKLNIKIIIAGLVSVSSLLVYENILSDGSLELAHQKQSLDIF